MFSVSGKCSVCGSVASLLMHVPTSSGTYRAYCAEHSPSDVLGNNRIAELEAMLEIVRTQRDFYFDGWGLALNSLPATRKLSDEEREVYQQWMETVLRYDNREESDPTEHEQITREFLDSVAAGTVAYRYKRCPICEACTIEAAMPYCSRCKAS